MTSYRAGQSNERSPNDGAEPGLSFRSAPRNLDAEQALLGAILVNNAAHDRVSSFLEPHHFYEPLHQQIYETVSKLIASGKQATPITLKTFFEKAEPIDAVLTVSQYLGRLATNAVTIINARDYGRTIYDLATRRGLIVIGEDVVNAAYDSPVDFSPKEQIEEAETRLFALAEHGINERASVSASAAFDEAIGAIQEAYRRGDGLAGISTGIAEVDAALGGGLVKGNVYVLAGRPSMGKTALATNFAQNAAQAGTPTGFVSLEMPASELALRILASEVGVAASELRRGRITDEDMRALVNARMRLANLPLTIEHSGGLTLAQLATKVRRLHRKGQAEFVVIDYLQLLRGSVYRGNNRTQEIGEITGAIKAFAKELDVPIMMLSQLSRAPETREDKRPQLSDLRDSGSIEQDADVVMFVYREGYYLKRRPPNPASDNEYQSWQARLVASHGKAELIVAKLRSGPTGTVPLVFDDATMTFHFQSDQVLA